MLAATTIPSIWAEAHVATDVLKKIGFNVDFQALEWGTVVQRRASKQPIDKGGWNIFYTYLGGFGTCTPAGEHRHPRQRRGRLVRLADRPEDGERCTRRGSKRRISPRRRKSCEQMQAEFWKNPSYVPLGMYDQPTAFHTYLTGIHEGWPQFYGVKKNI